VPTIWCVVPFSRPKYAKAIFERFAKQTYADKRLVIVENGAGVGACKKLGLSPDLLLTSGKHQSWAKNEAILKLRALGHSGDYWSTWDDDDYYGPRYLEELAANLHKGDVIGKSRSYIKLSDDHLYLMTSPPQNDVVTQSWVIHGPTITARIGDSLLFEHLPFAEDLKFVHQMKEQGGIAYATSQYNWCYMRGPIRDHTWMISDEEFKFANSNHFIDYGAFDEDVVNGIKEVPGELVVCNSIDIRSSFTYKEVQRSTGGSSDDVLEAIAKQMFGDNNEKNITSI